MIANYHTHTWRCNHASGTEEEYIQAALDGGLSVLGFSDHTPYPFPGGYASGFRMEMNLLADYAQTILALKKAYSGRITLHLGAECEYYPGLLPMLRDQGLEYLILGQHFPGNEIGEPYCGRPTGNPEDLNRYCHQVMDAMNTGLFTYFAHPDLIRFTGDRKYYAQQMGQVCREAKSCGVPLELNLLGIREGRWYPNPVFLEAAAETGNEMILGCDAHHAGALNDPDTQRIALELIQKYDLTLLDRVALRPLG